MLLVALACLVPLADSPRAAIASTSRDLLARLTAGSSSHRASLADAAQSLDRGAARARANAVAAARASSLSARPTSRPPAPTAVPSTSAAPSTTTGTTSSAAPSSATATATNAGHPSVGAGGPLSWAPPAGYAKFPVTKVTSKDSLTVVDGRGGDVRVELSPDHSVGPVTIANCRNAVLIGGDITVLPSATVDGADQRAIYIKDCTGTVHIEGVHINGAVAGAQSDGIAANAPQAVVQIQNVRMDGLKGGYSGNHADVFQPWGGVRDFRIDRLSGSTNYQGLHIFEVLGKIGGGTVRNADISSSDVGPVDKGGYYIWMDCTDGYPLVLDNVYVQGRSGRSFGQSVWPSVTDSKCPSVVKDGVATWPGNTSLTGGVHDGSPATGDFVPAGSVGLGYSSPGYL